MAFTFGKRRVLGIRTIGDPCLRKKSERVDKIDREIFAFAESMIDSMFNGDGVGLAASQVGVNLRIVSLGAPSPRTDSGLPLSPGEMQLLPRMPLILINPEIISASPITDVSEEGCLSVPDIYAPVERPVSVVLKTQFIDGSSTTVECGGFLARVIQHELDHLDGVLFVDKLEEAEYQKISNKIERLKKKRDRKGLFKRLAR
jgi:peptide deformylase